MQLGMVHRPQVPAEICIPGDPRARCPRGELGDHTDIPRKVGVPQQVIREVAPHPLNPSEVLLGPAEGPTRPAGMACTSKPEMGQLRTGYYEKVFTMMIKKPILESVVFNEKKFKFDPIFSF